MGVGTLFHRTRCRRRHRRHQWQLLPALAPLDTLGQLRPVPVSSGQGVPAATRFSQRSAFDQGRFLFCPAAPARVAFSLAGALARLNGESRYRRRRSVTPPSRCRGWRPGRRQRCRAADAGKIPRTLGAGGKLGGLPEYLIDAVHAVVHENLRLSALKDHAKKKTRLPHPRAKKRKKSGTVRRHLSRRADRAPGRCRAGAASACEAKRTCPLTYWARQLWPFGSKGADSSPSHPLFAGMLAAR
jgi:hypothetical protein